MNLLEDARRDLIDDDDCFEGDVCPSCGKTMYPHLDPDRVQELLGRRFSLRERLVAALEAAEAVAQVYDEATVATYGVGLLGSPLLRAVDALERAMRGEGETA